MWTIKNLSTNKEEKYYSEKDIQEMTCFNCGEKVLNPTGAELYDKTLDYKMALKEIRDYILDNTNFDLSDEIRSMTAGYDILKIIDEVLKRNNEQ